MIKIFRLLLGAFLGGIFALGIGLMFHLSFLIWFLFIPGMILGVFVANSIGNDGKAKGTSANIADELFKLKSLQDKGVITQDEFEEQKTRLLKR